MNPSAPAPAGQPARAPDPELLARRADRERAARKAAELLLTNKSRELYAALQRARDSEHRLQMALWASGEGIWEWREADQSFQVSGLLIGSETVDWPPTPATEYFQRIAEEDREAVQLAWRMHLAGQREDIDVAYRLDTPKGRRWVRVRGRALAQGGDGRPTLVAGTIKDITRQREAEQSLHRLARAFASTHDALAVVDSHWRIIDVNQALADLVQEPARALIGASLQDHVQLEAPLTANWRQECELTLAGRVVPVAVAVTEVAETALHSRCHIVAIQDISERRLAEARLQRLALHDQLTELPNRAAVNQGLHHAVHNAAGLTFAVLFMDLDGFKAVNDSFGHRAGDALLQQVAQRLLAALPEAVVGRWGGDEFVVILPSGSDEVSIRQSAQVLIATLAVPFTLGELHEVRITPSIGAVLYPQHGTDAETLLRHADTAMYVAKDQGKNGLQIYAPEIETGNLRRVRLQSLLRLDAERSAFDFVVQPKVSADGQVCGGELLIRWQTQDFGAVSPVEFIPIAEQSGSIELLGRQALHHAARLVRQAQADGGSVKLAVNLSPRQLLNADFERIALRACERFGIAPTELELELTESALASGVEVVQPLLQRLRQRGFTLALDDFGTGYSSLSHLLHLPFNKVKIDRAFVKDIRENHRAREVIRGALQICRGLGLSTVAEGVETEAQFALLRELGVDEFQGFLFSRPLPQTEWLAYLAKSRALPSPSGRQGASPA